MSDSDIAALLAIDAIKRLKARYFRSMDERAWDDFAEVLHPDCEMRLAGDPPVVLRGREAIVASAQAHLDPRAGVHLGHMPEIELTGAATATGRWRLLAYSAELPAVAGEVVEAGTLSLGAYEDDYVLESGRWQILRTTVSTAIRVHPRRDAVPPFGPSNGVNVAPAIP